MLDRRHAAVMMIVASLLLSGCASRVKFPALSNLVLVGDQYFPDGDGPYPAVVMLAPCGGVTQHMGEWARWLKGQGYAALVVDSFSPRRSTSACLGESPRVAEVARDAIDALIYLKTLPIIDANRVAVIGWSHGAGAALYASSRLAAERSDSGAPLAFRAALAFYPPCEFLDDFTKTPTLLLLAGRDDWTPPEKCVAVGELARQRDRPVTWQLYQGALHAFDRPAPLTTYLGHTMAYDGSAAAASREEVRGFLLLHLRGTR